jgi:hypothetical protein
MTQGTPIATQFPKKISAKDSPHHGGDALVPSHQRLGSMLPRRAAAEVAVHQQHARLGAPGIIERVELAGPDPIAIALEGVPAKAFEGDAEHATAGKMRSVSISLPSTATALPAIRILRSCMSTPFIARDQRLRARRRRRR